jgi:hypothetical protein
MSPQRNGDGWGWIKVESPGVFALQGLVFLAGVDGGLDFWGGSEGWVDPDVSDTLSCKTSLKSQIITLPLHS